MKYRYDKERGAIVEKIESVIDSNMLPLPPLALRNFCPWCRIFHEPGKCERLISGGQSD